MLNCTSLCVSKSVSGKSYVRRKMAWILATSTWLSNGLAIKSSAPRAMAMTMFMLSLALEMNTMGTLEYVRIFSVQ